MTKTDRIEHSEAPALKAPMGKKARFGRLRKSTAYCRAPPIEMIQWTKCFHSAWRLLLRAGTESIGWTTRSSWVIWQVFQLPSEAVSIFIMYQLEQDLRVDGKGQEISSGV